VPTRRVVAVLASVVLSGAAAAQVAPAGAEPDGQGDGRRAAATAPTRQVGDIHDTIAQYPGYGEYVGVDPARVLDTRSGVGGTLGKAAAGQRVNVDATAPATVPDDAWAVAVNVTVTEPDTAGFLTVVPGGASFTDSKGQPLASNLNFAAGQTVPNLVVVGVFDANGIPTGVLSAQVNAGSAHIVMDVVGYVIGPSAERGARLESVAPTRVADSRTGLGVVGGAGALGPGVTVLDLSGVPAGATGVALNVTATEGTEPSFLTVYGGDVADAPNASSVTVAPGVSRPNLVFSRVAEDGRVNVFNFAGNVHVAVDLVGVFSAVPDDTTAGRLIARGAPYRSYDTRVDGVPLGANAISVNFYGLDDEVGVGAPVQAALINVTVTAGSEASYLSVYPATGSSGKPGPPNASVVNWVPGEVNPNLAIVKLGPRLPDGPDPGSDPDQFVGVYNFAGRVHFLFDEFAYVLA
jgi:hypothetical protein